MKNKLSMFLLFVFERCWMYVRIIQRFLFYKHLRKILTYKIFIDDFWQSNLDNTFRMFMFIFCVRRKDMYILLKNTHTHVLPLFDFRFPSEYQWPSTFGLAKTLVLKMLFMQKLVIELDSRLSVSFLNLLLRHGLALILA